MARGWEIIARKAAATVSFWLLIGLIPYFGIRAIIRIEATGIRLFLVVVVFGVAFGAASLLERLLLPTDIKPNTEPSQTWPRWYSGFRQPIVHRQSDDLPYSYVVLPRSKSAPEATDPLRKTSPRG